MISTSIKSSTYENVVVDCPLCRRELIFNRVSDLETIRPISGTRVSCPECEGALWINGDTVNERHEAIIFDSHNLLKTKRYMNCILNICQAYEMFFSLYLRVKLIYVPFGLERSRGSDSLDRLNETRLMLSEATAKLTFVRMRGIFLRFAISSNRPADLEECESLIDTLRDCGCPKDAELENWPDKKMARLLVGVKQTKINELRNKVVHKDGYRPRKIEAETAVKEARSILFPLTYRFDLHDDINSYLRPRQ